MLKPLLFILVIVMLLALALNFNWFSDSVTLEKPIEKSTEKIKIESHTEKQSVSIQSPNTIVNESNLSKELQALLIKAQKLFREGKDTEAIALYDQVIKKSENSKEVKILKLFAKACFQKAMINYVYPNYDMDAATESYELIVNNFQNKYNKELLISYMQAKLQQAKFTSKEELLVAYDELIEKFQKDKEKRFEKEIEELLFAKSFALMGVNDEEAIEVLDNIIAKYDDKSNLPDTVKFSIVNNIELSIITSNDAEKYIDLANEYMADSPDTKPLLDMLNIIQNAQDLEQSEALKQWNDDHSEYVFPGWDFSELRKWVNKMETPESQKRIRQYLDIFEKQKYKNRYQTQASTVPISPVYSNEATQNTSPSSNEQVTSTENEEPIEEEIVQEEPIQEEPSQEEIPVYEPDPYLNDIIGTQAEGSSYPNPYSNYELNSQPNEESHTDDSTTAPY